MSGKESLTEDFMSWTKCSLSEKSVRNLIVTQIRKLRSAMLAVSIRAEPAFVSSTSTLDNEENEELLSSIYTHGLPKDHFYKNFLDRSRQTSHKVYRSLDWLLELVSQQMNDEEWTNFTIIDIFDPFVSALSSEENPKILFLVSLECIRALIKSESLALKVIDGIYLKYLAWNICHILRKHENYLRTLADSGHILVLAMNILNLILLKAHSNQQDIDLEGTWCIISTTMDLILVCKSDISFLNKEEEIFEEMCLKFMNKLDNLWDCISKRTISEDSTPIFCDKSHNSSNCTSNASNGNSDTKFKSQDTFKFSTSETNNGSLSISVANTKNTSLTCGSKFNSSEDISKRYYGNLTQKQYPQLDDNTIHHRDQGNPSTVLSPDNIKCVSPLDTNQANVTISTRKNDFNRKEHTSSESEDHNSKSLHRNSVVAIPLSDNNPTDISNHKSSHDSVNRVETKNIKRDESEYSKNSPKSPENVSTCGIYSRRRMPKHLKNALRDHSSLFERKTITSPYSGVLKDDIVIMKLSTELYCELCDFALLYSVIKNIETLIKMKALWKKKQFRITVFKFLTMILNSRSSVLYDLASVGYNSLSSVISKTSGGQKSSDFKLLGLKDYSSIKSQMTEISFKCYNALECCSKKVYTFFTKNLIVILFDKLRSISLSSKSGECLPLDLVISLTGDLFSSSLLCFIWDKLKWYLVWVISSFDSTITEYDETISKIIGLDYRIHKLEMRRDEIHTSITEGSMLTILLESILQIFSNNDVLFELYSSCDCAMDFCIYLLEDFVYFLTKIYIIQKFREENNCKIIDIKNYCRKIMSSIMTTLHSCICTQRINDVGQVSESRTTLLRKINLDDCISILNLDINDGFDALKACGFLPEAPNNHELAEFLYSNMKINGKTLCKYLFDNNRVDLLNEFISLFNFRKIDILSALRALIYRIELHGESQQISRFIDIFARYYFEQNRDNEHMVIASSDAAQILAFSIVMLNTDLHNKGIKVKMSAKSFRNNLRGLNDGRDFPEDFLNYIYNEIELHKLSTPQEIYTTYLETQLQVFRSSTDMLPCVTKTQINITLSREILNVIWRPVMAIFHKEFNDTQNTFSILQILKCLKDLARIANHLSHTEILDLVLYSLIGVSRIVGFNPTQIYSYTKTCIHCNSVKTGRNREQAVEERNSQDDLPKPHYDYWSVEFGHAVKCQMATILAFEIWAQNLNLLDKGWGVIIVSMQNLFLRAILPTEILLMRNISSGPSIATVVICPNLSEWKHRNVNAFNTDKKDTGLLQSLSNIFSKNHQSYDGYNDAESSQYYNDTGYNRTVLCIKRCNLETIITSSRLFMDRTLLLITYFLVKTSFMDTEFRDGRDPLENIFSDYDLDKTDDIGMIIQPSEDSESRTKEDDIRKLKSFIPLHSNKVYHPAVIFNLNILIEIALRNMDRYNLISDILEGHILGIIGNIEGTTRDLISSAVTCIISLSHALIQKDETLDHAINLINSLADVPSMQRSRVITTLVAGMYIIINSTKKSVELKEFIKLDEILELPVNEPILGDGTKNLIKMM